MTTTAQKPQKRAPLTPMAVAVRTHCGTIKAFAKALGVSASKAGMICQGRYIRVWLPDDVRAVAAVLNLPYQEVVHLISISYRQWSGHETPDGWISWDPAKPDVFAQVKWERALPELGA